MAKASGHVNGNGTTVKWIASALFAVLIVLLGADLAASRGVRAKVNDNTTKNAAQDATLIAMSASNRRIEGKVDKILDRLINGAGG